jgi:hypothetical protein
MNRKRRIATDVDSALADVGRQGGEQHRLEKTQRGTVGRAALGAQADLRKIDIRLQAVVVHSRSELDEHFAGLGENVNDLPEIFIEWTAMHLHKRARAEPTKAGFVAEFHQNFMRSQLNKILNAPSEFGNLHKAGFNGADRIGLKK